MKKLISNPAEALADAERSKTPLGQAAISGLIYLQLAYHVQPAGIDLLRQAWGA